MEEKKDKKTVKGTVKKSTKTRSKTASKTTSKKNVESVSNKTNIDKNTVMEFISSYKFLYSALAILLVIVLILGVVTYRKVSEFNKTTGDMVFPLIEEGAHTAFSLDLFELSKEKDYTIKISNYRGDTINKNDVSYTIKISNSSNTKVIVTKDEDKDNLITNQKECTIEGDKMDKNTKKYTIYHISIDSDSSIKKGDKINIEINS